MGWLEESAGLVFTSSAVVMGISLVMLSSSWKTLKDILLRLPPEQRKIIFNLRGIKDKRIKFREELKSSLYIASIFLGIAVFCNIASLISVGSAMVGLHGGPFELENYNGGRYMLLASVTFLSAAVISIGWFRISEAIAVKRGNFESIDSLLPRDDVERPGEDENNNEVWARCGKCGTELKPSDKQCPKCGSTKKAYERKASVRVGVKIVETRATQKRIGFHKFVKQMISRRKRSGDPRLENGVQEETIRDKEKGWYDQVVRDAKTGEITHEEHEPLSKHKGKPRKS